MGEQLGTIADGDRILDPAMGSGTLLCAIIDRLIEEGNPLEIWVDGFELDEELYATAQSVLREAVAKAAEHSVTIHLMADKLAQHYPTIDRFVFEQGWIEIGSDENSMSFIRALDPGGLVWEGEQFYDSSLDDALADLEHGLAQWLKEIAGPYDD